MSEKYEKLNSRIEKLGKRIDNIWTHLNLTGAGKRTCDECGGKFGHTCHHMGISKPTPDLPLNARVAKALGLKIKYHPLIGGVIDRGFGVTPDDIPDYDTDLPAAMGALEEYKKHTSGITIHLYQNNNLYNYWVVHIDTIDQVEGRNRSLPQAICEAIVKHSEQQ